ncbi:N-acetyltransferase [Escherichia coli]|nr:N-acetyltransferase [Escherichia coli]
MIKIEKVINKNDLKAFIAFPSSLYPDDPNWIPPLFIERNEHLSAKNPGTDHIIWQAWVAKKAGQIVGRITAQIDTLHRERYGEDTGPFSLNINQESGLLIEGFDTPPCAMMPHGKPWYAAHIEQLGYHKGIDLLAWWMQRTDLTFSPALKKLMDQVRKKVTIRCINRQRFAEEMQILREIFNSGWQHNWGFVPFTEHEFATMGDQLKYLVPDDMIYIAEIDSAPCAFIVGLPNINEAIADLNGSLFPFGWAKLLWRLKVSGVRTARVPLMGVRDEYQFSRIGPVIALLLIEALRDPFARRKIDALEMSWILETNTGMNNMLERIGAEPYKRYRLYEKQI